MSACRPCRYIEEVLGVPAMAAMGRLRRRTAAAVLLGLVCARASPALSDLRRLGKALAVATRACLENDACMVCSLGVC